MKIHGGLTAGRSRNPSIVHRLQKERKSGPLHLVVSRIASLLFHMAVSAVDLESASLVAGKLTRVQEASGRVMKRASGSGRSPFVSFQCPS
jgi:hypothetical protein